MFADPAPDSPPADESPAPEALAREALTRAKEAAVRRGAEPGQTSSRRSRGTSTPRARPGDPELVGTTIGELLSQRGWRGRATVATLFARWADLVGSQVAEHCEPRTYDEGKLHVAADSTAWATHMRALAPDLLRRLEEELGEGIVRDVRITGPTSPSWSRGPRRVKGRGPRDTYG